MITIIIHRSDAIELRSDKPIDEHVVVVNMKEHWTDSPEQWKDTVGESEQAEFLANLHNDGFADRNP